MLNHTLAQTSNLHILSSQIEIAPLKKETSSTWKITSGDNRFLADQCSRFLYQTYILEEKWDISQNNLAGLKITADKQPRLIDDYSYKAHWLSLEKDGKIIAVLRYYLDTDKTGYELERYTALPRMITQQRQHTAEINRISIDKAYQNTPALIILLANLYQTFEKHGIRYSFGTGRTERILKLYTKLGLNDITELTDKTKNYLKENNLDVESLDKFSFSQNDPFSYHLLWAENSYHQCKLLKLYQRLQQKHTINVQHH